MNHSQSLNTLEEEEEEKLYLKSVFVKTRNTSVGNTFHRQHKELESSSI